MLFLSTTSPIKTLFGPNLCPQSLLSSMNPIRLLCCFLLLISSLVWAEKYALLVGINDYQNDIGALKYCVADVQAFLSRL